MSNQDGQMSKDQMLEQYEVHSFLAPMCVDVTRKVDGARGFLSFADYPDGRRYFNFLGVMS